MRNYYCFLIKWEVSFILDERGDEIKNESWASTRDYKVCLCSLERACRHSEMLCLGKAQGSQGICTQSWGPPSFSNHENVWASHFLSSTGQALHSGGIHLQRSVWLQRQIKMQIISKSWLTCVSTPAKPWNCCAEFSTRLKQDGKSEYCFSLCSVCYCYLPH